MQVLFDIGHPAHVHLFRSLIVYIQQRGCGVVVVSRDKDVCRQLLNHYAIEFQGLGAVRSGPLGMARELLCRDAQIVALHRRHHFALALGSSVSVAHLTALCGVPSFCFTEDDDSVVPLYAWSTYPFATRIINPAVLKYRRWGAKRILYDSYQELAYLHPAHFSPDRSVPARYGLLPGQYVVVRKSALRAHHDVGARGLNDELWEKLGARLSGLPLVWSVENDRRADIAPWDMHDILAFAKLIVSDSQTMTAEAAVLGTPAIRFNSFAKRLSYLNELEARYGLTFAFAPGEERACMRRIDRLLEMPDLESEWARRRAQMLNEKQDFGRWLSRWFDHLAHALTKSDRRSYR